MGVKSFFKGIGKKIWGGIKFVGKKALGVVKKILPFATKVGKVAGGIMQHMPGVGGMIGRAINGVANGAEHIVNALPGGKVKEKLKGVVERGRDVAENANEEGGRLMARVGNGVAAANKVINAVNDVAAPIM